MWGSLFSKPFWEGPLKAFDALTYPMECQICGQEGVVSAFCMDCQDELIEAGESVCERCAMPVGPWTNQDGRCGECRGLHLGFDRAYALGPYQGPIRHLCLRLKRRQDAWLARWLADTLYEARENALREVGASALVPIPLHWARRWKRGFNQAEVLADHLAVRLGLPSARLLRRVKPTALLARKGRVERQKLLRGAFQASIGGIGRSLKGKTILLVDDVLTTGATCGAAARALKQAGVGRVVVAVIGRAGHGP